MKQYEAVIKVMEENGGFATLGFLYKKVLDEKNCVWKTKTPYASIRRIVQDERFFFKIRPGLWGLKSYKDKLGLDILPTEHVSKAKKEQLEHSYYQGLLVELGNARNYQTFVPNQDKNKNFLGKKLSEITTLNNIYKFSYENIVRKAKTVDVIWFNERNMPANFFEVEHSSDMRNSLFKFCELQDFNAFFCIVSNKVREREFYDKLTYSSFKPIFRRVRFWSYEDVAELHSKTIAYLTLESRLNVLK